MLAYAAHRRRIAERHSAPHAMMVIMVAHIAVIAAVMSAKMDLPERIFRKPLVVTPIPIPAPPPPDTPAPPRPAPSDLDVVPRVVPLPLPDHSLVVPQPIPSLVPGGEVILPNPQPPADPYRQPMPVRVGPRFATPPSAVRPPYPASKIQSEEEAVLRLRLSIDPRGRVVAVDAVGRADPAFLAAARRHLIAHWRYQPATEDGRAIASSTTITLRFELET